jgi:raffinose/stachyose/melibiose transport system substrate-binding protein
MKKAFGIIVTLSMITALLAGCGSSTPKSSETSSPKATDSGMSSTQAPVATTQPSTELKGKITFLTHRTDVADTTLTDIAKEFMAKNPGVEITVEANKSDDILKTRIAANELPDIMLVPNGILQKNLANYFIPIDDLGFNKDNIWYYNNGTGPDGKLYTLSIGVNYQGIIYNKNAFKTAGIDKTPMTLDELYADAEKLKAKGIIPVASNFKDSWPLQNFSDGAYSNDLLASKNYLNTLVSKDLYVDEPGSMLDAAKFFKALNDKGDLEKDLMSTSWDGSKRDLAQGKTAMTYLGTWLPAQIIENGANAADIGMFPIPGAKALVGSADVMYGVTKNSKSPEVAKAFLQFMWQDGYMPKKVGMIPPNKDYKPDQPFVQELFSSNLPVVEWESNSQDYQDLISKSQIDGNKFLQEYTLSKNPQEVVDKYNKKWADTRKLLGK